MKRKAKIYKGKRVVIGNKNLVTKNEIHVNDIPQEGSESGEGGNTPGSGGGGTIPMWTGHADAEGLRAIGWADEDIAYYQENGVNWNAEDDEYHKVSKDNKALYGVLTADNISTYKDRIVYLPKIDTSAKTSMYGYFKGCSVLEAIPLLDTSNVTDMSSMFESCSHLTCIPPLNTSKVTKMQYMFKFCYSLLSFPECDTSSVTTMYGMFSYCVSLVYIKGLDGQKVTQMREMCSNCFNLKFVNIKNLNNNINANQAFYQCYSLHESPFMSVVTEAYNMFSGCYTLKHIPNLDVSNITSDSSLANIVLGTFNLNTCYIKGLRLSISLIDTAHLSKNSLLYLINNEAATSAITITLHSYAYTRLAEDADVVAALAAHPNISLAK